jgi:hypothetical protein
LTRGGRFRRLDRSVWSGFRPDTCEGAWQDSSKRVGIGQSIRYGQNSSRRRRFAKARFDPQRTGDGRKRAMSNGVKFGRKPKLSEYQRKEALKRRAAGETLAEIAKSYAVDLSMISRLR